MSKENGTKLSKEEIERILQDIEETPGAYSIAEFETKENRAFDRGWIAAIQAIRDLLSSPERLAVLGINNE